MKTKTLLTGLVVTTGLAVASTNAAVINVADYVAPAGATDATRSLGTTITNEPSVYMRGTITWKPDATTGEATANFHLAANQERAGFGSRAGVDDVMLDGGIEGNGTGRPNDLVEVDTTAGVTTSYTFVLKVDQTNVTDPGAGNYWTTANPNLRLWVNPNLGATEGSQAATMTGWWSGQNNFTQVFFNLNGLSGPVDFTNFAVYTGDDTPFVVPEPASLGLLGLAGTLMGRRRRA